ncbi:cation/H(+) antiporter 15-like [Humulus lupulus]|uniref:cation/H(+) antiporter 15-like n=1 Tax=Humulus lupulus TaxID=3486 RepID=UPI002B40DA2F|nr:cation/H(+) antiporter 15-like [Humulus lupulus]
MNESTTGDKRWVCADLKVVRSAGIFFGDNPFDSSTSVLYVQLSISALLTAFLQLILNPLGQSAFISQMLVGIALGPSVIGDNTFVRTIFPETSFYISGTFAFFGCMLFMFLVGVKMDLGSVLTSGRKAVAIGLCCFILPFLVNTSVAVILKRSVKMDSVLDNSLFSIACFQSMSSFYVTACLLTDLKLLNSELGRLAVSSSMISGTLSWLVILMAFTVRQSTFGNGHPLPHLAISLCVMLVVIVGVLRPVMRFMVRNTNRGRAVQEHYIVSVFLMVLWCAFLGEFVGQHFMLGPMILGLAVPDGPPLGSALVDKLESYVSSILLPSYFVYSGSSIDLDTIDMRTFGIVWLLVFSSFFAKLVAAMVPSFLCQMPLVESLALGLVLSTQGITDILIWQHGMMLRLVDKRSYGIMVISTIVMTGTITPLIKLLYNPSKKYASSKRRTIEHASENDSELRMLACIHRQDNTPSIIHLLQLSNPTMKKPICFYVVHLIRLVGRSSALLITHRPGKRKSSHSIHSSHIINAFHHFEEGNEGKVIITAITAMAPSASMHNDVCTLAMEKRVSMVIIPFHKQWTRHGADETLMSNPVRTVNLNILRNAPCSVGILVDRGALSGSMNPPGFSSKTMHSVGMIFVEGPDDREALAYATRMAEQPTVGVTVVRLRDLSKDVRGVDSEDDKNILLDSNMLEKFMVVAKEAGGKKRHHFKYKGVKNCLEMIDVIRSMEKLYELIVVGRRHSSESPLFSGLMEWSEYPELGFIGDLLASSHNDRGVSLLVIQQQSDEGKTKPKSPRLILTNNVGSVRVDIPRSHSHKVHPLSQETNRQSLVV